MAKRFVFLLLVLSVLGLTSSELFSAAANLEELGQTHEIVADILRNYVKYEELRIAKLRKLVKEIAKTRENARDDFAKYVSHPVNAFLSVKRLTADWNEIKTLVEDRTGLEMIGNMSVIQMYMPFPTKPDLSGAAVALARLQNVYRLGTTQLVHGLIHGVESSENMTADDSYYVGVNCYEAKEYYHSLMWFVQALKQAESEPSFSIQQYQQAFDYMAFTAHVLGYPQLALKYATKLLRLVPTHPHVSNIPVYKAQLAKVTTQDALTTDVSKVARPLSNDEQFERSCRGDIKVDTVAQSKLFCRFESRNNPWLFLQPIKLEEVFGHPQIFLFHDVLSDSQIERVKELSKPQLKRSTVQDQFTGDNEPAQYRISQVAWLLEGDDPLVDRINKRIGDVTGLSMETAEGLQVGNYGIGGHYMPHLDFSRKEDAKIQLQIEEGNRIATLLLYMNDVTAGGATAFPDINIAVRPQKGSAVFWYNLFRSGEGITLTRHAACPVLIGNKWVFNKWIREHGQIFIRPCGLKITDLN